MMERDRVESETDKRRFDVKRYLPSALRPQDKTVGILFVVLDSRKSFAFISISSNRLVTCWILDSIR